LTEAELARYVLTDDPVWIDKPLEVANPYHRNNKLLVSIVLGNEKDMARLLGKLVERQHFAAVEEIVLKFHYGFGDPFWTEFAICRKFADGKPWYSYALSRAAEIFQSEVTQKVPKRLYAQFASVTPFISNRRMADTNREAVGIWEPYETDDRYQLVD
jgi:hypothetical protein